jgi:hypothetical protein
VIELGLAEFELVVVIVFDICQPKKDIERTSE